MQFPLLPCKDPLEDENKKEYRGNYDKPKYIPFVSKNKEGSGNPYDERPKQIYVSGRSNYSERPLQEMYSFIASGHGFTTQRYVA